MSQEDLQVFIKKCLNSPELLDEFKSSDESALNMLRKEGFDLTKEDIAEATKSMQIELSDSELEAISAAGISNSACMNVTIFIAGCC